MWLLDIDTGNSIDIRLLYSWIIQAPPTATGVTPANLSEWRPLGDSMGRFRQRRVVVNESATNLRSLVQELLIGRTLSEAAAAVNLAAPIPDFCKEMRLGDSATTIAKLYSAAPVRFLPTHAAAGSAGPAASMNSPSSDQPTFVGAFARLDKASLFKTDSSVPLPGADELARQCMTCLNSQTNLRFSSSDGGRLGNLEYLCLPAADCYESGDVIVGVNRDMSKDEIVVDAVSVSVRAGVLPEKTPLLMRCRIFAGQEVATDTCVPMSVGETRRLPVDYEVSGALVTIWRLETDGSANLWFEDRIYLIRQLVMHMGVMGLSGTLDTDWTRKLSNLRAQVRDRVDKVRSIQHVRYDQATTIGGWASWEAAEKEGSLLSQRLYPSVSEARFFPRGWDESGPGDLGFIEWFRMLSDNNDTGSVLIVDPFFGRIGVEEVLARVKATNIEYVVLTNAQTASKDDDPAADGPSRAISIQAECELLSDFLGKIRFKILDLRSKGGRHDQLFHDRYVLMFGHDGGLKKGYHLSNSIQGATKKSPLLVTPIPIDVLEKVGAYVAGLMEGGSVEAEIIEIASTEKLRAGMHISRPRGLDAITNAGEFFASLFGVPSLGQADSASLADWLRHAGAMEGDSFVLTAEVLKRLQTFVADVVSIEDSDFSRTWSSLSEYMARLNDRDSRLSKALVEAGPRLEKLLEVYLKAAPGIALARRDVASNEAIGLGPLLTKSFSSVLREAGYFIDHHVSPLATGGFSVHYAAKVLREMSPRSLIAIASQLWHELPKSERENAAVPRTRATLLIVWQCLGTVLDGLHGIGLANRSGTLTAQLLESDLPLFRALGSQRVIRIPVVVDPQPLFVELARLALPERLTALCEWVSELRVIANRAQGQEEEPVRSIRTRILAHLAKIWPDGMCSEDVRALAIRMGGPGEVGWAESTTTDLLALLVEGGKLSWKSIETLWFSILADHLGPMLTGAGGRHHFYAPNDGPLTRAWVMALLRCPQTRREERWQKFNALRNSAIRTLSIPFVRSRSFEKWFDVVEGLHWAHAFVQLLLSQGGTSLEESERATWKGELSALEKILKVLPATEHGEAGKFAGFVSPNFTPT
jgi:hypothetical protein